MFSKVRFCAFSDAVFAIAITLLVLRFSLPPLPAKPTDAEQIAAAVAMWPQFLIYLVGFATVGVVWLNHNAHFRYINKVTHGMVIANLLLLSLVALVPLPTDALVKVGISRVAVVFYGLVLTAIVGAYVLLYHQVLAAHPDAPGRVPWLTLIWYPLAMVLAFFMPIAGLLAFALLAGVWMLPGRVQIGVVLPPGGGTAPPARRRDRRTKHAPACSSVRCATRLSAPRRAPRGLPCLRISRSSRRTSWRVRWPWRRRLTDRARSNGHRALPSARRAPRWARRP